MKTRTSLIEWSGDLRDGGGQITTQSGALKETPFGFGSRFLDEPGTNPEELLAAAHASCLATHLAMLLSRNGTPPEDLRVSSSIHLARTGEERVRIASSKIDIACRVARVPETQFRAIAQEAATDCPISRALGITVDVTAKLI